MDYSTHTTPAPEVLMERAARVYAARGWPVLPLHLHLAAGCTCGQNCRQGGKHPRTTHGVKDATTDQATISAWWKSNPLSNLGIATGAVSGLVILDVDPQHGGEQSLQLLEACFFPLPDTLRVATGGGGSHLYFRASAEGALPNKVGIAGLPGLDLRADGGYIVAPPSLHRCGDYYRWVSEGPLAPLPYWLWHLLIFPPQGQTTAPVRRAVPVRRQGAWLPPEEYWYRAALQQVKPGNRNAVGYWLAKRLRDKGVEESSARALLQAYAVRVGGWGDHPYTEQEALASLASAYHQ